MAIDMENKGTLYSYDIHENKLSLVTSSAKRLKIDIISTTAQDGRKPIEELLGTADRIICDVPCSGFGVIAKKPEIRYHSLEKASELPAIQRAILDASSRAVKAGGTLVYSTCTLFNEENEAVVKDFLAAHADFALAPFEVGSISSDGMLTLLPDDGETDGFFIAKMTRTK